MGVLDDVMLEAGNSKEKETIEIRGLLHPAVIVSNVKDCQPLWNPSGDMEMWAHMSSWDYYFFTYGYTTYKTWEPDGDGERCRLRKIQVDREDVEAIAAYLTYVYNEQKGKFDYAELYDKFPFLNNSKFVQRCAKLVMMNEGSTPPGRRTDRDTFKHPTIYRRWIPSLFAKRVITGKHTVSHYKAKKKVDWMIYNLMNPVTNCPFAMQDIAFGKYLVDYIKEHGDISYLTVYDYIGFYYFSRDYYHVTNGGENLAQEQALAYKTIDIIKESRNPVLCVDEMEAIGKFTPRQYLRLIGDYATLPVYMNPYAPSFIRNKKEVMGIINERFDIAPIDDDDSRKLMYFVERLKEEIKDELRL